MTRAFCRNWSTPARFRAGLLAAALFSAHAACAQDIIPDRGTDTLSVELSDDRLTLEARNARLRDVLAEIVRQGNLTVVSRGPLANRVTLKFEALPLAEALRRILRDQSYLLRIEKRDHAAGKLNDDTIWVFSNDAGDDTGFSLSSASMAIQLLRSQLASDDTRTRAQAIRGLRKLNVNEVVEPLGLALADEERKIQVKAIYALAEIGGDDAVAVLAGALGDEDAWIRSETAYALGAIGEDSAIPFLRQALFDSNSEVRASAMSAFSEIGGAALADALGIALLDPDPEIRVEAVEAIWSVGGETAVHLLNKALQDDDDAVREAARDGLASLSSRDS